MARKINLKALYNNGDFNVTTSNVTETGDSNGVSAMFDNNLNTIYKFDTDVPFPSVTLTFSKNILASKIFVKITTTNTTSFWLNVNNPATSNNLVGPIDSSGDTTTLSFSNLKSLNSINIRFSSSTDASTPHIVNQLELYVLEESDSYEFNDSVLETKAWNSSRYSGRQLQASAINEFTNGDVTYGKTPVLQNYTRNIYLGSRVIGMQSGSYEDETLVSFNGFSYVTVHEYITVNDDLSITRKSIRATGDEKRNFITKKGFYPIFYHDFPIGSEIEINTLDEKLVESLKPSYRVFNNSGQLQKLLLIQQHPDSGSGYAVTYRPDDNQLHYATGSTNDLGAKFTIYNQALLMNEFFTGSLIATPPVWSGGTNPETAPGSGGA